MRGRPHFKSARLQERRRKVFIGWSVILLALALGVWVFFYTASGMSGWTIRDISVRGGSPEETAKIENLARGFLYGRYYFTFARANALLYPKNVIEREIYDRYPTIANVSVGLSNLHQININLTERVPVALWCERIGVIAAQTLGNCFQMDDTAFIFAPFATTTATTSPFLIFSSNLSTTTPVGRYYTNGSRLNNLLAFAQKASSAGLAVSEFDDQSDGTTDILLAEGAKFIVAPDTDLPTALENVLTLINDPGFGGVANLSKIDYIDLRFGSKIFYKAKK